ncbi:MAG: hypothetical protein LC751_03420 [Actinobacteria bacterium]|nr:hypothetical protein [Actinomycetota bacterium]
MAPEIADANARANPASPLHNDPGTRTTEPRRAARAAAHIALGPLANASGTNRSGYTISALELVYACRLGWETG